MNSLDGKLGIDLSEYSTTLPDPPEGQVLVDSTVAAFERRFGPKNEVMLLVGAAGTGKTEHLAQFVRQYPQQCFSYFVKDNIWLLRQSEFLYSLCTQMNVALGNQLIDDLLDVDRLKMLFGNLCQKIIEKARRNDTKYFFVVDGLEYAIAGVSGERIIDLLPPQTHPRFLYFFGSIRSDKESEIPFGFHREEPHLFSLLETQTFLAVPGLHSEGKKKIHGLSGGVPGYLVALRALLDGGQQVDDVLRAPSDIEGLLKIQWVNSGVERGGIGALIHGIVAYSLIPLAVNEIAEIAECTISVVRECLDAAGITRLTTNGEVEFQNELLRQIAREKCRNSRSGILDRLISHYEQADNGQKSRDLLPQYYFEKKDFAGVAKMLAPEHLVASVSEKQDITHIKNRLMQACQLAAESGDAIDTMKFGLTVAGLRTLSDQLIGESEVMALIALERFDEALELAYSSRLAVTRVTLLSQVYVEMERKGRLVPRESITEVRQMAEQVGRDSDPNELIRLARSLFPLLPDTTIDLLERAQVNKRSQGIMDVALAMASIENDTLPSDEIIDRIQDAKVRELALSHASWLAKVSGDKVIESCKQIQSTEAKEYLLRQWSIQNRSSDQLHIVLGEALNVVLSDAEYTVPLRNLRQLASLLKCCDPQHREGLARRFDVPNFTSLRVPIEERVRLELGLSEALLDISESQAFDRFVDIYSSLESESKAEALDLDVVCYCYVHILTTLQRLDPDDGFQLKVEVATKINETFLSLLDASADHFEVTRKVLRAISAVDPHHGISLARLQNTKDRREDALKEIAVAHFRQDRLPLDLTVLSECLDSIDSPSSRDAAVFRLAIEAFRSRDPHSSSVTDFLTSEIRKIVDPVKKSDCLAILIGLLNGPFYAEVRGSLFRELQEARGLVDILWVRVESAFNQVKYIATSDVQLAGQLYDEAKILRNTSSLANQTIGSMYYRLLDFAARVAGALDVSSTSDQKETWNQLLGYVESVPSNLLRAKILARIALARFRFGDKGTFDIMMRDKVLPILYSTHRSSMYNSVVVSIGTALFEYSRSEAKKIINTLPYHARNAAWMQAASITLANAGIGDPLDEKSQAHNIDAQIADKVVEIFGEIDQDALIYPILKSISNAVENPDSRLIESQKLDILVKLENHIDLKLPDPNNIRHTGYKIVCEGAIDRARSKAARRAKARYSRKLSKLIQGVDNIPNVADRVFVYSQLAADTDDTEQAKELACKSRELISRIPNVVDRISRLEALAEVFSQLHQTSIAEELISSALDSINKIEGASREQILASLIQTAHEIDSGFAALLTERIESGSEKHIVADRIQALNLAKSPERVLSAHSQLQPDVQALPEASHRMLKMLVSGRGVLHTDKTLLASLASIRLMDFDDAEDVVHWVAETLMRRNSRRNVSSDANLIVQAVLANASVFYDLGNRITFLSTVPPSLRSGFQGLSTRIEVFRSGERERAVSWIKQWLLENAQQYVKIYDPYFNVEQLWLLQCIPADVTVTIGATWKNIEKPSGTTSKAEVEKLFHIAWSRRSSQDPPPTLIVIEDTKEEPEGHDRFIVTFEGGLQIGTSFNGLGNKEFTITIMSPEDAIHVEKTYIDPRIDVTQFIRKTFVRL